MKKIAMLIFGIITTITAFCQDCAKGIALISAAEQEVQIQQTNVDLDECPRGKNYAACRRGMINALKRAENNLKFLKLQYKDCNNVLIAPTITANGATTFNAGGSVMLTSSAASSNQWYNNSNPISNQTASFITVTQSGNYTVKSSSTGFDPTKFSNTITVTVNQTPPPATPKVISNIKTVNGFNYKTYYQDAANNSNRKGIIILTHGDGGNENDGLLNDQCNALAEAGYVAITSSYRNLNIDFKLSCKQYKEDMEALIASNTALFGIARSRVILGGASRGSNQMLYLTINAFSVFGINPIAGIKGLLLECAGGVEWHSSNILFPVANMSNEIDDVQNNANANDFKKGLTENPIADVRNLSECLIIPGTGHCGGADQYKAFILKKVKQWLP